MAGAVLALVASVSASRADESPGANVFSGHCAVCHGPEAAGIPGSFPSLHEQIVAFGQSSEGRDYLVMVVTTGLTGELKVGTSTYRGVMPAQSGLSETDVAAVLSYLAGDRGRSTAAPVLSAADVAAARARHPAGTPQATRALRPTPVE